MCDRYVSPDAQSIARSFGLPPVEPGFSANFNTSPRQIVPAVRSAAGKGVVVSQRWDAAKNSPSTVYVETLASSVGFRAAWAQGHRCIIPALGFYEWHVNPDGTRQPYYIHADDQDVLGFAGLWQRSTMDANGITESCAIITVPANPVLAEIDNSEGRMPAILSRAQRDLWLFGAVQSVGAALGAYPTERTIAYPVSSRIDSLQGNDEALIEPLETDVD
jgi:putative SOS response-associated peptidase YedK